VELARQVVLPVKMAFLVKYFVRICFLKVQLYLCIYLFLYLSMHIFFILLFFSAEKIFKVLVWISSIKLRELQDAQLRSCWMVQGLIHTGSFGKKSLSLCRGNTAFQGNQRCNFSHFPDMVKSELLIMKIASWIYHVDWIKYIRYEQSTSVWIF